MIDLRPTGKNFHSLTNAQGIFSEDMSDAVHTWRRQKQRAHISEGGSYGYHDRMAEKNHLSYLSCHPELGR